MDRNFRYFLRKRYRRSRYQALIDASALGTLDDETLSRLEAISLDETSEIFASETFSIKSRTIFLIRPSDRRGIGMARYRNMRSKRRCSLCLQFALLLGAGPVLHRPTSLVIHRLEWNLSRILSLL